MTGGLVIDSTTEGLMFGNGDTGFYEPSSDAIYIKVGGTEKWVIQANQINGLTAGSATILNVTSTSTTPTLVPSVGDYNTGIGAAGLDQLSLIAGGVEGIRVLDASVEIFHNTSVDGDLDVSGNFRTGGIDDNITIDASGQLRLHGEATAWDDLRFPATYEGTGVNNKPDFDFTNLGLLFPENNETEIVYHIAQFSHSRKSGSNLSPHIHYIQEEATPATFVMEYKWYDNGDTVPGSWTTLETSTGIYEYTSGSMLQLLEFPTIDGSSLTEISSSMDIKVYRKTGDGVSGDVLYKEMDIHFEIDGFGSDTLYTKK